MLAQKQLITDIHQDVEWQYLVGETLIGERMIVQALAKIVRDKSLPSDLLVLLEEQLDVEAHPVTLNAPTWPGPVNSSKPIEFHASLLLNVQPRPERRVQQPQLRINPSLTPHQLINRILNPLPIFLRKKFLNKF